jgi:pyruvate/2-oxoglutarate dehydrogenase complex dihydrolipoamide dehydrogenase (E3) component
MKRINTDICVIGAGSGGLSVASGAAQMGARVVLIEGHKMGGDCLNYGCVPSKALIAAAKAAHAMQGATALGVAPATAKIDYAAAKDHVQRAIDTIAPHDSQDRFEGLGVTVIRDWGRFISPREVQAGDTVVKARRFVIATGSSPLVPPIPGLDGVPFDTNETIFALRERPEHLIVIGGGPIGMEMAQAHQRLGSRVTVIEAGQALGREDPELAAIALERLRAEGLEIVEGEQAARQQGNGGRAVTLGHGAGAGGEHHRLGHVAPRVEHQARPAAAQPNAGGQGDGHGEGGGHGRIRRVAAGREHGARDAGGLGFLGRDAAQEALHEARGAGRRGRGAAQQGAAAAAAGKRQQCTRQ